jgi:hypothetical protein
VRAISGYIGEFEIIDDHRSGKVVIELIGRINKCGVISPRFDITLMGIEQWTNNLLPSRQFGYIVMTTSLGIMDHEEVRPFRDTLATGPTHVPCPWAHIAICLQCAPALPRVPKMPLEAKSPLCAREPLAYHRPHLVGRVPCMPARWPHISCRSCIPPECVDDLCSSAVD